MTFTKTATATLIAAAFPAIFGSAAWAQSNGSADMYQRNVYQQQRIEQGLRDGSLTVQEAARLEQGQARINQMESRAAADGRVSRDERARINDAQNRQSAAIDRERNDGQRGDPNSRSSQRMREDVQRNVNEQRRIAEGVHSGQITNREAARLEHGQARTASAEARAGRDGHIDRYEQRGIQHKENHQSRAIHHERHDSQTRSGHSGGHWNQHSNYGQHQGWNHANNNQHHGWNRTNSANSGSANGGGSGSANSNTGAGGTAGNSGNANAGSNNANANNGHRFGPSANTANSNNGNHYGQFRNGNQSQRSGTQVAQNTSSRGGNGNRR